MLIAATVPHNSRKCCIYDPDKVDFTGWLRQGESLELIEEVQGWTSPRLGIKFELEPDTLLIYRPNGEKFLEFGELDELRRAAQQRAERAELEVAVTKQDVAKLAAKLRELGVDPDRI